jgi:hypothetical protein
VIRKVKLNTEPEKIGTIDILFEDPLSGNWQTISIKAKRPYRPDVLFSEIKSWLKKHGKWNLRGDECGRSEMKTGQSPKMNCEILKMGKDSQSCYKKLTNMPKKQ